MLDTPWGSSVVVHILHRRVSANGKDFGTSDNAGVDDDAFACRDFAKAEAFVDDEIHDFGLVREGVREAGFVLFIFLLVSLNLQPFQPPNRHVRLRVELPLPSTVRRISRRSWVLSTIRSSSSVAGGVGHRSPR